MSFKRSNILVIMLVSGMLIALSSCQLGDGTRNDSLVPKQILP